MRGYVDLKNGDDCSSDDPLDRIRKEAREKIINELVQKWNTLHRRIEARQWDAEGMQDTLSENLESTYECAYELALRDGLSTVDAHWKAREAVEEQRKEFQENENRLWLELEAVEDILGELGARMMRPYEHWNEEERYMEYMETRYDYDYRDQ